MRVKAKMIYLGVAIKESKKTQKQYSLAKFMEGETAEVYEFYVPSDKLALTTKIGKLSPMTETALLLEMSSFQGKPQVDLSDVDVK